jgi:hypothetical protein
VSAQDIEAGSVTVTLPAGSASPLWDFWYYYRDPIMVTSMPDSAVVPLSDDFAMVDVSAIVTPSAISRVGKQQGWPLDFRPGTASLIGQYIICPLA